VRLELTAEANIGRLVELYEAAAGYAHERSKRELRSLTLVRAAQLGGGKYVVGERLLDLSLVCPRAYADLRVEGVTSPRAHRGASAARRSSRWTSR
jgi:hypothetical protein